MKNIIRGLDDIVYRLQIEKSDGTEYLLSDFDSFDIAVFTSDCADNYIVESQYIDADENLVRIPADKIASSGLADGIIRLQLLTSVIDSSFDDGSYNQTNTVDTCYFLKTITDAYSGDIRSPIPVISVHSVGNLQYRRQS
jgi:hypothetical protein